jgi:hypothetical protein
VQVGSLAEWVTALGIILPLCVLAWSAFQYVRLQKRELQRLRFDEFFAVMDKIGSGDGSIASKVAGIYELRRFPEYKDVILRFCSTAEVVGHGSAQEMLTREMKLTADFMNGKDCD